MKWFAEIIVLLAVLNLLVFGAVSSWIGGDPGAGKIIDGHYFVSGHGHLREVSAIVFYYSQWHVRSLSVTQPLGGLAGLWLWLRNRNSE